MVYLHAGDHHVVGQFLPPETCSHRHDLALLIPEVSAHCLLSDFSLTSFLRGLPQGWRGRTLMKSLTILGLLGTRIKIHGALGHAARAFRWSWTSAGTGI